jgi:large subunit ribosomal protein L29
MKASELRDMSDEQLTLTLKETADNYFRLRTQGQTERLDAPSELRKSSRLIARVNKIKRERALAAKSKAGGPQSSAAGTSE